MTVKINSITQMRLCGLLKFQYGSQIEGDVILTCTLSYVQCLTKLLNPLTDNIIDQPERGLKHGITAIIEELENDQQNLNNYLNTLYEDPQFSDMTIYVKEKPFYVHTSILSYYPYFKHLIQESKSQNTKDIHIQDIEPHIFKFVLCYIYTGVDEDLKSIAHQVLPVANKFDINTLQEKAIKLLRDELTIDNMVDTYTVANEMDVTDLKSDVKAFTIKNINIIKEHRVYGELKQLYPDLLIQVLDTVMNS